MRYLALLFLSAALWACNPSAPGAGLIDPVPDSQQIKSDLLGHVVRKGLGGWRFASLSEFEEFEVMSTDVTGNVAEIEARTVLKDMNSGRRYTADLHLVYRKEDGGWKLVTISDLGTFAPME